MKNSSSISGKLQADHLSARWAFGFITHLKRRRSFFMTDDFGRGGTSIVFWGISRLSGTMIRRPASFAFAFAPLTSISTRVYPFLMKDSADSDLDRRESRATRKSKLLYLDACISDMGLCRGETRTL